jgi:hypothetical protein
MNAVLADFGSLCEGSHPSRVDPPPKAIDTDVFSSGHANAGHAPSVCALRADDLGRGARAGGRSAVDANGRLEPRAGV